MVFDEAFVIKFLLWRCCYAFFLVGIMKRGIEV
jgi:hypothetical protein